MNYLQRTVVVKTFLRWHSQRQRHGMTHRDTWLQMPGGSIPPVTPYLLYRCLGARSYWLASSAEAHPPVCCPGDVRFPAANAHAASRLSTSRSLLHQHRPPPFASSHRSPFFARSPSPPTLLFPKHPPSLPPFSPRSGASLKVLALGTLASQLPRGMLRPVCSSRGAVSTSTGH